MRLALNPDYRALFQHPLVEAKRAEVARQLTKLDGEYKPGKLGELRGFLAAVEWFQGLPEHLAKVEQQLTKNQQDEAAAGSVDHRLASLSAG